MISVLFLEDEPDLTKFRVGLSKDPEFVVDSCTSIRKALDKARDHQYDVIVSGPIGLELAKKLKLKGKDIPLVIFTGESDEIVAVEAISTGMDLILIRHEDLSLEAENITKMLRNAVRGSGIATTWKRRRRNTSRHRIYGRFDLYGGQGCRYLS